MNTKNNDERSNTPNERDERYATGHSASNEKRSGGMQGGYREWSDNWEDTKAKLQKSYSQLTDNDLRYENGKEDELVTRLSQKLGRTPEDTRKLLQTTASSQSEGRQGLDTSAKDRTAQPGNTERKDPSAQDRPNTKK